MRKALEIVNEIFDCNVTERDLGRFVEDVIEWDSFLIMNFMSKMSERYQAAITVEQISEIQILEDLVELIENNTLYFWGIYLDR